MEFGLLVEQTFEIEPFYVTVVLANDNITVAVIAISLLL